MLKDNIFKMLCNICNKEFTPKHFNNKVCSEDCKKESRKRTLKKYNDENQKRKDNSLEIQLEGEIFKDIKGYEGNYKISNLGRVYSRKNQGILKPSLTSGYYTVKLCNKKHKTFNIHRLLGLHFIDNPNNYPQVDHINRIRDDNRLCNLRWVTCKENNKNRDVVINRKGCICKTNDEIQGKIYEGWRVYYYENDTKKTKRFKIKEEAEEFMHSKVRVGYDNLRSPDYP
tara:strand:- start:128 stop:811 length:684 start_codon:yes stop_codon:yes gene_type:complete